jgi:hypothetical protein
MLKEKLEQARKVDRGTRTESKSSQIKTKENNKG